MDIWADFKLKFRIVPERATNQILIKLNIGLVKPSYFGCFAFYVN